MSKDYPNNIFYSKEMGLRIQLYQCSEKKNNTCLSIIKLHWKQIWNILPQHKLVKLPFKECYRSIKDDDW